MTSAHAEVACRAARRRRPRRVRRRRVRPDQHRLAAGAGRALGADPAARQHPPRPARRRRRARRERPPTSSMTLRAGVQVSPAYFGSDDYELGPDLAARFDYVRFPGGFEYGSSRTVGFRTGWGIQGSFRYIGEREGDDEIEGLDDVPWSAEAGLGVGYEQRNWRAFTDVRYGFVGHNAWVGEIGADAIAYPIEGLTLTAGPRLEFGTDSFAQTYFGISPEESAASGLDALRRLRRPARRRHRGRRPLPVQRALGRRGRRQLRPPGQRRRRLADHRAGLARPVQRPRRHHPPDQPRLLSLRACRAACGSSARSSARTAGSCRRCRRGRPTCRHRRAAPAGPRAAAGRCGCPPTSAAPAPGWRPAAGRRRRPRPAAVQPVVRGEVLGVDEMLEDREDDRDRQHQRREDHQQRRVLVDVAPGVLEVDEVVVARRQVGRVAAAGDVDREVDDVARRRHRLARLDDRRRDEARRGRRPGTPRGPR